MDNVPWAYLPDPALEIHASQEGPKDQQGS